MNATAGAIKADPQAQVAKLARQIIDAIAKHPGLDKSEQTRQLAMLERALTLTKGAEQRRAVTQQHAELLHSLARTDFLTGLPNRRALEEHTQGMLEAANRHGDSGVLVLFDIDHFKDVNDNFGPTAGDSVLRLVGEVLAQNVRATDLVVRLGADQFAALLAHTGPREGLYRARRLQAILRETPVAFENGGFVIEASIGVAPYTVGTDLPGLFQRASIGLYRQKRSRGLRYQRLAS
jgi:diguanylate cyclase (GGDEF)-like protein